MTTTDQTGPTGAVVDLMEALAPSLESARAQREATCRTCDGLGLVADGLPSNGPVPCPTCAIEVIGDDQ